MVENALRSTENELIRIRSDRDHLQMLLDNISLKTKTLESQVTELRELGESLRKQNTNYRKEIDRLHGRGTDASGGESNGIP